MRLRYVALILSLIFLQSSIVLAGGAKGTVKTEYYMENKKLMTSPLIFMYAQMSELNVAMKDAKNAKVFRGGRSKIKLLPGTYQISAMCGDGMPTSLTLKVNAGVKHSIVCSKKSGKFALIEKPK